MYGLCTRRDSISIEWTLFFLFHHSKHHRLNAKYNLCVYRYTYYIIVHGKQHKVTWKRRRGTTVGLQAAAEWTATTARDARITPAPVPAPVVVVVVVTVGGGGGDGGGGSGEVV